MTTISKPRLLGFWMCVALVVGNMIGSGIFLLPASLAPYGLNSLVAWVLTATGAMVMAAIFAALVRAFPSADGPYAYTRMTFGDLTAFIVAWGYWISIWVGNAAIATGAIAYLSLLLPWVAATPQTSAMLTIGMIWLLTGVNVYGARTAGKVQVVTTVMKLLPLLSIVALAIYLFISGSPRLNNSSGMSTHFSLDGITAAATLTLWGLLGLESATIPAGKVHDPARTIPRATLIGTALTALIYVITCSVVLLLIPADVLKDSNAPFAEVARMFWGDAIAQWFAVFAAISAFGALNGWILLQGELPLQMAKNGVFPKLFAKESTRGTPVNALCISSGLVTILVLMNAEKSMVEIFNFMILLSTTATLVMYLLCALATLKLLRSGELAASGKYVVWLAIAGLVGAVYALWTIVGAGIITDAKTCGTQSICWAPWYANPMYMGAVLLALGIPVYFLMRGRKSTSNLRTG